ncbi:hypothetical protein [Okeania sp. KiyG1]|uniref:hypothetical protein n=1 Tax=Okeania sp. KiyG1 TaxID=2720165 RepID=UPI0019235EEB|nr:hypothetical protein [Okeania sp. KiyG1]GGA39001.1 hypothetical protein CYANOKiyG1_57230 [Okeania sp. KiyG1]GGA53167.1 hypothetical protein CYANOKiyG1_73200 [Okeania sp. KiyG1]
MVDSNFTYPPNQDEMPLPDWAGDCLNTFCQLFEHEVWREGKQAIETLHFEAKLAGHAYIKEGMILRAFQIYKLYRCLGYRTFQDYCLKEIGKKVWRCKQLMEAAMTGWHLLCEGFQKLPNCVAQASALRAKSEKEGIDGDITADWQKCIDMAATEGEQMTAHYIEAVLDPDSIKKTKQVKLPFEVWQALKKKADRLGLSVQEYLEQLSREEESEPQEEEPTPEDEAPAENQGQDQHNTEDDTGTISTVQTDNGERGCPSSREILPPNQFDELLDDPIPY